MGAEASKGNESWPTAVISLGKDFVSLLRDEALFVLAVLLVAFPGQFNSLLVDAGFEESGLVGSKWRSKLVESNHALQEAQATISDLQQKNDELAKALAETNSKTNDPPLRVVRASAERTWWATQGGK